MKSMRALATVVAVFGMSTYAQAGLLNHLFGHKGGGTCDGCDASKCCDCAPSCVPEVCKPVICRPTHRNVYEYQRRISCLKPPCCNEEANVFYDNCCTNDCLQNACAAPCGPAGCAPCAAPCGPGANACAPCGPGAGACAVPCGPAPCGPGANACAVPCGPGANACAVPCGPGANACAAPCGPGANACCPGDGCVGEVCCRRDDACKVAKLIYKSQTACDPDDREDAIDDLGDYDMVCYPEIMCAMVYALNDADPGVRAQAGDEIGDALEDNPCLATQCVIDALTCALADCDKEVVDQAEEALEAAGYEIVDCCDTPCDVACAPGACVPNGCAPMGQPVPMQGGEGPAPAPAPPEDTKAYFPKQLPPNTGRPLSRKFSLSRLFSMAR
jgi:hypothetical protein